MEKAIVVEKGIEVARDLVADMNDEMSDYYSRLHIKDQVIAILDMALFYEGNFKEDPKEIK